MANIKPFRGLRYNMEKIGGMEAVTIPPYDVISPEEQERFYNAHPNNFIRLELGRQMEEDDAKNNRYTRTAAALREWIDNEILVYEDKPAVYLYEEKFTLRNGETKSFKGFMTLVELAEFSQKIVLPHEETLSKAKADRFELMRATNANFSQIYCLYMDPEKKTGAILSDIAARKPDVSFTAFDGTEQNLWVVTEESVIAAVGDAFADKQLFIADGHHRYETALKYRDECRKNGAEVSGADYVMMMLVEMDDPGLVVFPTHRVVSNLESYDLADSLHKIGESFTVEEIPAGADPAAQMERVLDENKDKKVFALYTGSDSFYLLTLKDMAPMRAAYPDKSEAYIGLDVSVLHTLILNRVFGIDPENMADQKNLTYVKLAEEAVRAVKEGGAQCCFLLNATKVREIKDVSLANEKMPQKSTYFYPKLLSGLVVNDLTQPVS